MKNGKLHLVKHFFRSKFAKKKKQKTKFGFETFCGRRKKQNCIQIGGALAKRCSMNTVHCVCGHCTNRNELFPISIDSLPWAQDTLIGYIGTTIYEILLGITYFIANGSLLLLFISICLHHEAFFKMFQHLLRKLETPDKHRNDTKYLCKIIRLQISARE